MAKGVGSYVRKCDRETIMAMPDCYYCGKSSGYFELDHIVPPQKGGRPHISNYLKACNSCNASKNDKLLQDWLIHCIIKRDENFIKTKGYLYRLANSVRRKSFENTSWLLNKISTGMAYHSMACYRIGKIKSLING